MGFRERRWFQHISLLSGQGSESGYWEVVGTLPKSTSTSRSESDSSAASLRPSRKRPLTTRKTLTGTSRWGGR